MQQRVLWIDLETTGLDPEVDKIIEVAAIETTIDDLTLEKRLQYKRIDVIVNPHEHVELMRKRMHPVPFEMHARSGLLDKCLESTLFVQNVERMLLDMVDANELVILAGTSVMLDWRFLQRHMPFFARHLHYRVFDVRTLIMECESLGLSPMLSKGGEHRATRDIECSIADLKACRAALREVGIGVLQHAEEERDAIRLDCELFKRQRDEAKQLVAVPSSPPYECCGTCQHWLVGALLPACDQGIREPTPGNIACSCYEWFIPL
jgi:oligoribonuclease